MRLAFADTRYYVADPKITNVPIEQMISKEYANERRKLIDTKKANIDIKKGSPGIFRSQIF